MEQQKNLILAVVLSLAIIVIFQVVFPPPPPPTREPVETAEREPDAAMLPTPDAEVARPAEPQVARALDEVLAETPRVAMESERVKGSVSLRSGRIDDLTLLDYRETIEPGSPLIRLLAPRGTDDAYYAQFGWRPGSDAAGHGPVPGPDTEWTTEDGPLAPDQPVTLRWDNGAGLVFETEIALDENFMFTVTQRVRNAGDAEVTLFPYGLISRLGMPDILGFYILHEGLIGVFDGTLKEVDYEDLQEQGETRVESTGGWLGITDKYWLVALIPEQDEAFTGRFLHSGTQTDRFQADFVGEAVAVPAGGSSEHVTRLFAGAKEVRLIDAYERTYGITMFNRAVDWGWFFFLTKPIFWMVDYINTAVGNFGVAILILTVLVKLLFFPLANKSYRAMSQMKKIAPEMQQLRERFAEDKVRMNQELMELYKREKVNPASGCWPILIQIPVFFALYKVLFITIEMRHAPFFGWVQDLSAPDPTTMFNLFGLIPWDPPQFLMIGAWPLIMGATMFLQQRLNPQPPDPIQARIFMVLPVVFTIILAPFPAGLVIYWAWNNILSIVQQWTIMKRMGVKP